MRWFPCALLSVLCGMTKAASPPGGTPPPGTPHQLRIACRAYLPGSRPQSIGEPLQAYQRIADRYRALHPDRSVRIEFQPVPLTGAVEGDWVRAQLSGGVAPEIVGGLNVETIWPDELQGWWIPLDPFLREPNPYAPEFPTWLDSFANRALTEAKRSPSGRLYCLPIDLVETAIFYNKDIFEVCGIPDPATWSSWAQWETYNERLLEEGFIPVAMWGMFVEDWLHDIVFDALFREVIELIDLRPTPANAAAYMTNYLYADEIAFLAHNGVFSEHCDRYVEVWRIIKGFRRYLNPELRATDPVRLFLTGRAASIWSISGLMRRLTNDPSVSFAWGLFYPPPITTETSRYACGDPMAVVGGAATQLAVTRRSLDDGELDLVIDFLRFLTAPANASELINEAGLYLPNIKNAELPAQLEPFQEILKRRYTATKWVSTFDPQFQDQMRRSVALYVNDGIPLADFLENLNRSFALTTDRLGGANFFRFEKLQRMWTGRRREFWRLSGTLPDREAATAPPIPASRTAAAAVRAAPPALWFLDPLFLTVLALPLLAIGLFALRSQRRSIYIPLALTFMALAVFNFYPAVNALRMAVYRYDLGLEPVYVGFEHFRHLLTDPALWQSFVNLMVFASAMVAAGVVMPLAAAELIFALRRETWRYFFRCLFVVPMLVPIVAVGLIWRQIYSDAGPINEFLRLVGLHGLVHGWLTDPRTCLAALIGVGFPYTHGFFVLILYAGLSSLSPDVCAAARLDGAGPWRTFFHIHVPHLLPQVKIVATLAAISAVQGFENVLVLTRDGGPGYLTMLPGLYMYQQGFSFKHMGYASAIGLVLFVILFIFTLGNLRLMRSRADTIAGREHRV